MAHKILENFQTDHVTNTQMHHNFSADGKTSIALPDPAYVKDANFSRDGYDLVLELNGETVVIEGYFLSEPAPNLVASDGTMLTPDLVNSFTNAGNEYAQNSLGQNDTSPVGAIQEITGEVTVTRADGTTQSVSIGTPIFQGDIIETEENGAVNIIFVDETTFAVSEDARLAIDEFIFDPSTQSGSSNFSVLKGVFVFTSGLIGRENPDDVLIETPAGSIGIRGTIIAGDLNSGEITVIEGAIVLTDFSGNSVTLSNQYETARFNTSQSTIEHMGDLSANDVVAKFESVSRVAADTFASIQDTANETKQSSETDTQEQNLDKNTDENNAETKDSLNESNAVDIIISEDIIEKVANKQTNTNKGLGSKASESSSETQDTGSDFTNNAGINPTFQVSITRLPFFENDSGAPAVARITGNFVNMTDLTLNGVSQNFFDIVRESDNSFLITVKAGKEIDFEAPKPLFITATSGNFEIITNIDLNTLDENETVTDLAAAGVTGLDNTFRTGIDSTFIYDFSQEFDDPENEIIGYNLITDITGPNTSSPTISSAGIFTFVTDGASDMGFNFTVQAVTAQGTFDLAAQDFEVLTPTVSPPNITTAGGIYEGNAANINILADDVVVFATNPGTSININVAAQNAYVNAGNNGDVINVGIGSANYRLYGDLGNDTFNLSELTNGKSYGGFGADTFVLQIPEMQVQLENPGTNTLIDGGNGFDTLALSATNNGNIDFSNVNANYIKNIERLGFENGQTNIVNLDYNSVIEMTDEDNRLYITLDNSDQLNFNNTSGHVFVQIGNDNVDGVNFNIFTDGEITLLIDADVNANGII